MPLGFTLLAGLPARFVAGSQGLQVLPALAWLASLALFPVVLHRLSGSALVASMGAALAAAAPLGAELALRVKHYTLDQLVTVAVLLAMTWLLRERSVPRFGAWMLALGTGLLLSFSSVFLATGAVVAALLPIRDGAGDARSVPVAARSAVGGAFLAATGAFFLLWVRRASRPVMVEYWGDFFPASGAGGILTFLTRRASAFLGVAVPGWAGIFLLLAPLGLVWLWREGHRAYCVALIVFYASVLAAAFARVYPMGTGRTDAYATPVTALLVCLGASELLRRVASDRGRRALHAALIAVFAASLVARPGPRYPRTDDRAAVEWASARLTDQDALLLSPYAAFAEGYYGGRPIRLAPADYYGHGFDVVSERPRTLTTALGRWDVADARGLEEERRRLASFVDSAPARLLYVETQGTPSTRATILRTITEGGLRLAERTAFGGPAEAFVFVRE